MSAPWRAAAALLACGGETLAAAEIGARQSDDPSLGDSLNVYTCRTCHPVEPESVTDGRVARTGDRLYPGYTLFDSAFRESFWGGYRTTLLSAVDFCVQHFMKGEPIDPASDRGRALYDYLASISPTDPAPALPLTVVENIIDPGRGTAGCGEQVYDGACAPCHGEAHTGLGRLGHRRLADADFILPETVLAPGYLDSLDLPEGEATIAEVVVEKVRHGQFFLVGGNMPPFARETLSDADLAALLAYLGL